MINTFKCFLKLMNKPQFLRSIRLIMLGFVVKSLHSLFYRCLSSSYLSVPGEKPLLGLTVGQLLEKAVADYGEREAAVFVHQNIRKTFFEVNNDVDKIASGFVALGLKHGDRIGILGPNSYEWYLTQFASAKAGLILGTTGAPKGATLSHHSIVNNAFCIGLRMEYDKQIHRICLPVPLYHCFGCVVGTLNAAIFGASCIFPNDGFDPLKTLLSFEKEHVTTCYGTPTMFIDILNKFHTSNSSVPNCLSSGIIGGASCPQTLINAIVNEFSMKIMVCYGMTETSPVSFQSFTHDPPEVRSSTLGYPGSHLEVKVVNEKGSIVPRGETGELWIRGYCNFLGYWDDDKRTSEIFTKDRWLKTGDLVVLQEDGYGKIVGRISDMIIRGGENIYPAEIENFYMGHDEIIETQVFGVPDERMGEEVAMWVKLKSGSSITPEEIKIWSKEKIAHYKIPHYIFIKQEFPTTVTGKIKKFVLREETIKELHKNQESVK